MSVLNQHKTIPKQVATQDDLDYHFLRKKGLEYLQELGGQLWTDFNLHDPGVTMLELLCYAITDLGMRIDMPIEDLLTGTGSQQGLYQQFHRASEILPSKPVTALDYRKLFIDIDGVNNCWLRPYRKTVYVNCKEELLTYNPEDLNGLPDHQQKQFDLKGLYSLLVEYTTEDPAERIAIDAEIKKRYHAHRNLCEDLITIEAVNQQAVKICADIEVEKTADEEWVHALVLQAIHNYLAPGVRFYGLKELLDEALSPTTIFEGPLLHYGFIKDAELVASELRSEVRLSDLINIIMEIEGVVLVKDISLSACVDDHEAVSILCITPDSLPVLCDKSVFNYNKDVLPLNINAKKLKAYQDQLVQETMDAKAAASLDKELDMPAARPQTNSGYSTVMNDLPDTYGVSEIGLAGNPSRQRKALAKQLKGYLLFFDQILASYFKHLDKVKEVMSVSGSLSTTFFTQSVQHIAGLEELVTDYPQNDDDLLTHLLLSKQDNAIERRNQILDHLIARFAERFADYTFIMKAIYGSSADEIVLKTKEQFLADYAESSCSRGQAFNYFNQPPDQLWDTLNVSGLQKRLARLLGIKDESRRHLTDSFVKLITSVDEDNCPVYQWQVKNDQDVVILESIHEYRDRFIAIRELYFSILQIIQTNPLDVKQAFAEGFDQELILGTIRIQKNLADRYEFIIINPEVEDTTHKSYRLAKGFGDFATKAALEAAILALIDFMKFTFTEEGLFLVEHILLRPDVTEQAPELQEFMPICTDECESCEPLDPYSYRVSIVIPGYTLRFYNTDFRNYMEDLIREELPAHVLAKICWVGYREGEVPQPENDLLGFEEAYKQYLLAKTNLEQQQPQPELMALNHQLSAMTNVYPTGRLYDCSDDVEELSGKVILGRTNLGSL